MSTLVKLEKMRQELDVLIQMEKEKLGATNSFSKLAFISKLEEMFKSSSRLDFLPKEEFITSEKSKDDEYWVVPSQSNWNKFSSVLLKIVFGSGKPAYKVNMDMVNRFLDELHNEVSAGIITVSQLESKLSRLKSKTFLNFLFKNLVSKRIKEIEEQLSAVEYRNKKNYSIIESSMDIFKVIKYLDNQGFKKIEL